MVDCEPFHSNLGHLLESFNPNWLYKESQGYVESAYDLDTLFTFQEPSFLDLLSYSKVGVSVHVFVHERLRKKITFDNRPTAIFSPVGGVLSSITVN